jgi:hypothetical protein
MNIYITLLLSAWLIGPIMVFLLFLFNAILTKDLQGKDFVVVLIAFFIGPTSLYLMWNAWKEYKNNPEDCKTQF